MDRLTVYRARRDFGKTPEPQDAESVPAPRPRFVVQEHHARRLHWDFRLERNGVLVSWAVPRGIPADPRENRLAVHTEDHPLSYFDFEGEIPEGNYGAGRVILWDRGEYEAEKFRDDEVIVRLHGEQLQGRYALFQTRGKDWMIHRMDPPQDPSREPVPAHIQPMLPTLVRTLPAGGGWALEIKWDGVRAIATVSGGRLRLESRNLLEITREYPEVGGLGEELRAREAVFDGEIIAFDENGRPSFERLQRRMGLTSERVIRRRKAEAPVVYIVFDLLFLDGHSLVDLPYAERRARLDGLALEGPAWRVPAYHEGDGATLLAASRSQGLEGLVAKRMDSRYEPGRRTRTWLKVKNTLRQEFVIGGYTVGQGRRAPSFGALLAGYYEDERLRYAGRVGTGLDEATIAALQPRLHELEHSDSPFAGGGPPKGSVFIHPVLVAEVEFTGWTSAGMIRHPSFKGLRADKDASAIVREREETA